MDNGFLWFLVFAFLAAFLLVWGVAMLWTSRRGPQARRLHQRMERIVHGASAPDEEATTLARRYTLSANPRVDALLQSLPATRRIHEAIAKAGVTLSVGRLIGITLSGAALPPVLALLAGAQVAPALLLSGIILVIPYLWLGRRRDARLRTIETQLPDTLDLISRALKAGHAFSTGLKLAADEAPKPIAAEFRLTFDEINFGVSMPQALNNMAQRVPSPDLQYFVIAVLIQRETGGNLTEILDTISRLIRQRMKLMGHVRVLTADARLSAWILILLPVTVAVLINYLNPGYLNPLWESARGRRLMSVVFGMMLLGVLWIRRIIRIKV